MYDNYGPNLKLIVTVTIFMCSTSNGVLFNISKVHRNSRYGRLSFLVLNVRHLIKPEKAGCVTKQGPRSDMIFSKNIWRRKSV